MGMTATERLRKLLDERGVEYDTHGERYGTWYDTPLGGHVYVPENNAGWLHVRSDAMTPEQAITATLGRAYEPRGTCHYEPDYKGFTWWDENDVEHYEEYSAGDECSSASCDECGYTMMVGDDGWFDGWDEITEWTEEDGSEHKGYVLKPRFKFCPNCGREVVE